MEDVIRKIVNIDKETIKIKEKTEEIINTKERELKEVLQSLEKEYLEEGKLEGDKKYKEIIEIGRKETEELQKEEEKTLKNIDNLYKGKKDKLVEELFHSLFKDKE